MSIPCLNSAFCLFHYKIDPRGCRGKMLARKPRKNQAFARNTFPSLFPRTSARRVGPEGRKVIAVDVSPRLPLVRMVLRSEGPTLGCAKVPALWACHAARPWHHRPDGRCYFLTALRASKHSLWHPPAVCEWLNFQGSTFNECRMAAARWAGT